MVSIDAHRNIESVYDAKVMLIVRKVKLLFVFFLFLLLDFNCI